MAKKLRIHISPTVGPAECFVDPSNPRSKGCAFGNDSEHFDSWETAQRAYERQLEDEYKPLDSFQKGRANYSSNGKNLTASVKERQMESLATFTTSNHAYQIQVDDEGRLFGDSSEGLMRFISDFDLNEDPEFDGLSLDYDYLDDEQLVVKSVYVPELDLEIENRNMHEDLREIEEYRYMLSNQDYLYKHY